MKPNNRPDPAEIPPFLTSNRDPWGAGEAGAEEVAKWLGINTATMAHYAKYGIFPASHMRTGLSPADRRALVFAQRLKLKGWPIERVTSFAKADTAGRARIMHQAEILAAEIRREQYKEALIMAHIAGEEIKWL